SVSPRKITKPGDFVDWLHEVLMVLVPEGRSSLMGLSLGGSSAAPYACRFPERLSSLVLLAPGATVLRLAPGFFVRLMFLLLLMRALGRSPLRRTCGWLFED